MPTLPETPSCAQLLKVLADDTRLAVLESLLSGPKHVNEINDQLHVEQTLLSHHLRVLREAGLVQSQREGKSVLYRLTPAARSARRGKAINLGCCSITFDGRTPAGHAEPG